MSGKLINTGKDTWLNFLPPLNPNKWPTGIATLANGFECIAGDPAAGIYKPTAVEIHARDQALVSIEQWSRACKVSASITRSTETTDISDDCNPDSTIVSKLVKSISFEAFNRKTKDTNLPIDSIKHMFAVYESEGVLILPVLFLDSSITTDGARGDFMLSTVSQFDMTGNLNDPVSLSVTLLPTGTPERSTGGEPMLNQFPVMVAETKPDDPYYYGEMVRYDADSVPAPTLSLPDPE